MDRTIVLARCHEKDATRFFLLLIKRCRLAIRIKIDAHA